MITLNLISPIQRKEIKLIRLYFSLKSIIIILLIFTIFLGGLVVGAKIILSKNYQKLTQELSYVVGAKNKYAPEIREINNYLNVLEEIQDEYTPTSEILIYLGQILPADLWLNDLSLNKASSEIKMRGFAKTRTDLLNLQNALKESGAFSEINIPISAILQKDNPEFFVTAKIDLKKIPALNEEQNDA